LDSIQGAESLDEVLSNIRYEKNTLANIDRRIKKYQKIDADSIDSIFEKNKLLDSITRYSESIKSEEIRQEIISIIKEESKKNTELLGNYEKRFGKKLYDSLKTKNLTLEGMSPKYRASFFSLEIDPSRNECKIFYGPGEELMEKLNLDPKKISDFIEQYLKKLEKRTINPSILNQSYNELVETQKGLFKSRVPIIKLLLRVALKSQNNKFMTDPVDKLYNSYGRIQFSYDLYKIRHENKLPIKLHTASRSQVRNRQEYL
jgi:hypothetical protein